jgi:hypothetical protein
VLGLDVESVGCVILRRWESFVVTVGLQRLRLKKGSRSSVSVRGENGEGELFSFWKISTIV